MPYALIDIIGIKEAFKYKPQEAADKCQQLWEITKNMALFESMDIKWVTFSDSVLINWEKGVLQNGQPLLNWLTLIISKIRERINAPLYAIGNQGIEVKPSSLHNILATAINSQRNHNYIHIAGLGDDFANLYFAEKEIAKLRKNNQIPSHAYIYLHSSLLTANLISGQNKFSIQGLSGNNEIFYYF